jgi:hypothetical protein
MEAANRGWPELAPLFHYYMTRYETQNGADANGFLDMQKAKSALEDHGICRETNHRREFVATDAARAPNGVARVDARRQRPRGLNWERPISGPQWVTSITDELRRDNPVVIRFRMPFGYPRSDFLNALGEWKDPAVPGLSTTQHVALCVENNPTKTALRIWDSQGDKPQFNNGTWWMSYRVANGGAILSAFGIRNFIGLT